MCAVCQFDLPVSVRLHRVDDVLCGDGLEKLPEPHVGALRRVARWLDGYISHPHPALGRSGDVCPWTRRTIELRRLFLVVCTYEEPAQIDALIVALMKTFSSLAPAAGATATLRAIVAVFPSPDVDAVSARIVAAHARLKPRFLEQGLMLGEFYPTCDKPGLRNRSFRPLWSEVPLLVIRPMVEGDIEFLTDRDEFVEAYLTIHGRRGRARLREILSRGVTDLASERVEALTRLADRCEARSVCVSDHPF